MFLCSKNQLPDELQAFFQHFQKSLTCQPVIPIRLMSEAKLQWCFLFCSVPWDDGVFSFEAFWSRGWKLKVEASGGRTRKNMQMQVKLHKVFKLLIPFCLYIKNRQVTEVTVSIMSHKSLPPQSSIPEMNAREEVLQT